MNFSANLREELSRIPVRRACCRKSALSALFHTAGSLSLSRHGFSLELTSRSEEVLDFALRLSEDYGLTEQDVLTGESGGTKSLKFSQAFSERVLGDLGIVRTDEEGPHVQRGIAAERIAQPCCRKQYVKGAFLGCGTVKINASSGYHLEMSLTNTTLCAQLAGVLNEEGFRFKYSERAEHAALYLKDAEEISDFLAYLGASRSVLELQELLLTRRRKNQDNRKNNCYLANVDKSFDASIRQVEDISVIEAKLGLSRLEEDLRRTCEERLDHPEATLAELAERLGISKSGLNHRMRRLRALAERLRGKPPEKEG